VWNSPYVESQFFAHEDAPMVERSTFQAMLNGSKQRCPACGTGSIYKSYLKVVDACPCCGQELHHQRADDLPAYFTMFIVGHIVVGLVMMVEQRFAPELWVHALIWPVLILTLSLFLLPRIKGAAIGLQWAQRMHGFSAEPVKAPAADPAKMATV
jgi:uncharacterized protein (DUF983 family)